MNLLIITMEVLKKNIKIRSLIEGIRKEKLVIGYGKSW